MAASFRRWESDPLFSAAEVVQDSADRMESIFRLLLHEQSLSHRDHPDPSLVTSIEHHRRDLVTTLETAKWQLEDFEKAVSVSATSNKSQMREEVVSRRRQFIEAIKEQIDHVEKSLEDPLQRDSIKNTEWIKLNEQDRDGLARFLTGGNTIDHVARYGTEDSSSSVQRFFDPNMTSSFITRTSEIVEHKTQEIENLGINGVIDVDSNFDSINGNKLRKVGSHYATELGYEARDFSQGTACDRNAENGCYDLEANEAKDKSFFHRNKFRGHHSRVMNILRFFGNLWSAYGIRNRVGRNFVKKVEDGEEEQHSPKYDHVSHAAKGHYIQMRFAFGSSSFQGLFSTLCTNIKLSRSLPGTLMARYERSPYHIHLNRRSMRLILMILFAFILLGFLLFQVI